MVREGGVVVEVKGGAAAVSMDAPAQSQCGSCGICRAAGARERVLAGLPAPEGLKTGDRVIVAIHRPGPARSAAILFLVPTVIFVGALVITDDLRTRGLFPASGVFSALVALVLMASWYIAAGAYDRHLRRSPEHQPRIVDWPGRVST